MSIIPAGATPVVGPVITAGSNLSAIATDPAANRVYVVDEATNSLVAIDGATNTVVGSVAVPARAGGVTHELAVDPTTHRVYVTADFGFAVVDGPTMRPLTRISTGATTGEFEPAVMPAAGRIYALRIDSVPGAGPAALIVRLLVFSQSALVTTVDIGAPPADTSVQLAVDTDPAVNRIYVANLSGGRVAVLDGTTLKPTFVTGHGDGDVTVDPATHNLMVVDRFGASLVVVDPTTNAQLASVGLGPPPATAADRYLGPVAVDSGTRIAYVTGGSAGGASSPDVISAVDIATAKVQAVLSVKGVVATNSTTKHAFAATPGTGKVTVLLDDVAPVATTTSTTTAPAPKSATTLAPPTTAAATVTTPPAPAKPAVATTSTVAGAVSASPNTTVALGAPAGSAGSVSAAQASLSVTTVHGASGGPASAGPPGVGLRISGAGFERRSCPTVFLFFGKDRIGTAEPGANGSFTMTGLTVPGDAATGEQRLSASCARQGRPTAAAARFTVEQSSTHRTAFVSSLHRVSQVPRSLKDLALSALIALVLLALVVFPSELFDSTLSENYDEVCGWFAFARPVAAPLRRLPRGAVTVVVILFSAALYGLLDPGFGLDGASLAAFTGMVLSLLVVALLFSVPSMLYVHRRVGDWGRLDALPAGLAVAAACVAMSRALHFQPGYIYGVLVGVAFAGELTTEDDGRVATLSTAIMLGGGVLAWVAWSVLAGHADGRSPSLVLLVFETMLAAVAVSGLETALVTLVPLRFLSGARIAGWNRAAWAGLFALAAFAFVDILLRPGSGYIGHSSTASAVMIAVLFVTYGLASVLFWGYFRFRQPRPRTGEPAHEAVHRTV